MTAAPKIHPEMNTSNLWEDQFLSWASGLGISIVERKNQIGAYPYFQFEANFNADGRRCFTYGRSQNRRLAAVKAVAEFAERKAMLNFFKSQCEVAKNIPAPMRTSNGWAVHQTAELAEKTAVNEALERHLLLLSYFKFGWSGFHLVQKIQTPGMDLYFLTSRFTSKGRIASLVIAKSPRYPGVSFGYCAGQIEDLGRADFWESALFEAADKILTLNGRPVDLSLDPKSWLLSEVKHYLETPFNTEQLKAGNDFSECCPVKPEVLILDLASKWGLDFPLFAAFAFGGGQMPLFHPSNVSKQDLQYIAEALKNNGIDTLPERHPVL